MMDSNFVNFEGLANQLFFFKRDRYDWLSEEKHIGKFQIVWYCMFGIQSQELDRRISEESVFQSAIKHVEESGIVFIDEIDKICSRGGFVEGRDPSGEGVQVRWCPLFISPVNSVFQYVCRSWSFVVFLQRGICCHSLRAVRLVQNTEMSEPITSYSLLLDLLWMWNVCFPHKLHVDASLYSYMYMHSPGTIVHFAWIDIDSFFFLLGVCPVLIPSGFLASDLLAELQGRLPIRVELRGLSEEDLYRILVEPEHNLIQQHIALMETGLFIPRLWR